MDDPSTEILPAGEAAVVKPPATPAASLVGRTLGKFKIVEKLGRGGSGDVYRAEQEQLGRTAVIKVLRRDPSLPASKIERFLREAKLASRLDHPYAAHVYAFGAEPDGELWIAMEHVRGATLDELVNRRGPIPPAIFGRLFGRVCEVVHSAHELGIVHRDIKGSNVMVIERAGQLLPKLLDFGIAKIERDNDHTDLAEGTEDKPGELTQDGATLGSPSYMSPEQWLRPGSVDARADIYALGILAYRCVSGLVPFRFADRATLIDAHLRSPPPPLPDRVPAAVGDAIMRALEKEPEARWPTALAFGEAIQRAAGTGAAEVVPIFDPYTRDVWLRAGPQPIADAIAHLAAATTTVEADAAVRELVAIACRWLAVLALSRAMSSTPEVREQARRVINRDDAAPWLELARAAVASVDTAIGRSVPGLTAALAGADALAQLAARLDERDRRLPPAGLATALAEDVVAAAEALRPIEPLLAYQLVVGRGGDQAESWIGARRRDRERVLIWGDPLADGEVALLDATGKIVARLSPLAQVLSPLPSAEPEMILLWRSGRGPARLVAAPWGFEIDDDAAGVRLASLTTEDFATAQDPGDDASPYPGLASYRADDAERFVGREREVETVANRLVRAPMLAVLGPSGAGKSSFIHAGLAPRLESNGYRVVTMRPGRHPMHALAGLPPVSGDSEDSSMLASRLRELGEASGPDLVGSSHGRGAKGLVIVIDQLEELITLCGDAAERARFASTLVAAANGSASPVRVVVTLRDDFAAVIESEAELRGRFEVFVLGTPLPEALRRIVVEPPRRANVSVEVAVVDDMVREVAGRTASLPLLSFTAAELWRTRDRAARKITREAYIKLGGVAGALSSYADQVYDSLARRDQTIVRALFGRLVATSGTRIPVRRAELEQLDGAHAVIAHLIDARLLVTREEDPSSSGPDVVVEIVHECLAERWERLAQWRREDAADRALLDDVHAAARRWQESGSSRDMLWRGGALVELRKLMRRTHLTDAERAFATASDLADRRARRIKIGAVAGAMAALAALALVMAYLSVQAQRSRDDAEASATEARDSAKLAHDRLTASLLAQGTSELDNGHELRALAYFAEVLRRGGDTPGLREMIAIASRAWPYELGSADKAVAMAAGDGGFLTGTRDGRIRWYGADAQFQGEIATGYGVLSPMHHEQGYDVATSDDHGVVFVSPTCCELIAKLDHPAFIHGAALGPGPDEVTVLEKEGLRVFDRRGALRRSGQPMPGKTYADVIFDTGAHHALVWQEGRLVVVDLATMASKDLSHDMFGDVARSTEASTFAYLDNARAIHVIAADGAPVAVIPSANRATIVTLSPSGDRVAAVSEHEVAVYERTGKLVQAFSADSRAGIIIRGDDVWTGTRDGTIRRYHAGILVASLPLHPGDIGKMVMDGDRIASVGADDRMVISRADAEQLHVVPPVCDRTQNWPVQLGVMSFCTDGRIVLQVGRHVVGDLVDVTDDEPGFSYDRATGRTAVATAELAIYDRDGKLIAASKQKHHFGDVAIEDADHVLALDVPTGFQWRWTFAADLLDQVMPVEHASAIAVGATGVLLAYDDGHVVELVGDREVRRFDVGQRVGFISMSPDRKWAAMQFESGGTVIVDAATGTVAQRLVGADTSSVEPSFDDSGALLIRPLNSDPTIWDRTTGLPLISHVDLLQHPDTDFVFGPGGVLEMQGDVDGTIELARDTRPTEALLEDIACRVPLGVVDGRLQAVKPSCVR